MPITPLDPAATPRLWINYTSGLIGHALQIRYPIGTDDTNLDSHLDVVIAAMLDLMDPVDSIVGVERAAALSNIRFPFGSYSGSGTATSATNTAAARASKISAVGKCEDGRLVAFSMYFLNAVFYVSPRIAIGVVAAEVAAWWASMDDDTGFAPVGIGGEEFALHQYVNTQQNQYWNRKQR